MGDLSHPAADELDLTAVMHALSDPARRKVVAALGEFSRARGHTLLELAVSWIAAQPAVSSVICGATRAEQVEQNVKAAGWALTTEELAEVDKLTKAA